MTQLAAPRPGDRVLEIGTGCGYQSAVLAEIANEVYTIEIVELLAAGARQRLRQLGDGNVSVRASDGHAGWPVSAPFDIIVVTASLERIRSRSHCWISPPPVAGWSCRSDRNSGGSNCSKS